MGLSTRARAAGILSVFLLALSALPAFAASPGNDNKGNPIVIGAIPYSNVQDTSEATTSPTDGDCGEGIGPTVWYQYTATDNARVEVNTFGSDYATTLYIESPGFIWCGTDQIRLDAEAGATYLFMVGSFGSGPGGSLTFNLFAPTIVPVTLDVTFESHGSFDENGMVVFEGTMSCSGADDAVVLANLFQDRRRGGAEGRGIVFLPCSAHMTWRLVVDQGNGQFKAGVADVSFRAGACNRDVCQDRYLERTIVLRGRSQR